MRIKLIAMIRRRSGLSAQEFREYYEHRHVPLATRLLPYFAEYQRNYIDHSKHIVPEHQNDSIAGTARSPDFDVITEFVYGSEEDYRRGMAAMADPEIGRILAEDEARFMDRKSITIMFVDEVASPQRV